MERKELLMALMMGVLLLTTAIQTITLATLSSGQIVVAKSTSAASSSAASSGASAGQAAGSLANLPSMVGGC